MNNQTLNELKSIVTNCKLADLQLTSFEDADSQLSEKDWHDKRVSLVDKCNHQLEQMEITTNRIWSRNLDRGVQKSVNNYRKKVGLRPWRITAML